MFFFCIRAILLQWKPNRYPSFGNNSWAKVEKMYMQDGNKLYIFNSHHFLTVNWTQMFPSPKTMLWLCPIDTTATIIITLTLFSAKMWKQNYVRLTWNGVKNIKVAICSLHLWDLQFYDAGTAAVYIYMRILSRVALINEECIRLWIGKCEWTEEIH